MQRNELRRMRSHAKRASGIAWRYFITNGFDGALTLLGLMVGFASSGAVALPVAIKASLGAAVAICMSGISSAYLSEAAERKHELRKLENALLTDLSDSDYGKASRYVPVMVALVNGLSPLIIALLIISPLWFSTLGVQWPAGYSPFHIANMTGLIIIFFLGVMLGKLSGGFWLWTGLRTLFIALLTAGIVYLF